MSMPRKPKRKSVRNHILGFLKMMLLVLVKKIKNLLLVFLEDFLGESRRDCREEDDMELMI